MLARGLFAALERELREHLLFAWEPELAGRCLEGFVRATQARRQPGSSFKPYVYAAALLDGKTQLDQILDGPISLPAGGGKQWAPHNYDGRFWGLVSLRQALASSLNTAAVRLTLQTGVDDVVRGVLPEVLGAVLALVERARRLARPEARDLGVTHVAGERAIGRRAQPLGVHLHLDDRERSLAPLDGVRERTLRLRLGRRFASSGAAVGHCA
jgi:penicillin-binding protein 1A